MEELDGKLLKYGFLRNHALLSRRLSTTSILHHVYGECLVTTEEKARIQHQYAEGSKTDIFLDILHRQGVANPNVYLKFFNLLSDESITSGQNLKDVLKQIKKDAMSEEVRADFQYERRLLEENDHQTMLNHKSTIVRTLSVDNILPELVSCGVVSSADKMKIMSEQTLDKQAQLLFDIIRDRGSLAFGKFVKVLEDSDKYQGLGKQLRLDSGGSETTPDPHQESLEFIKTATNIQTVTDGNTNESTQISNPNVEDFQPKIVDSEKGIMMQESVTIAKPNVENTQTKVEADGASIRKLDAKTLYADLEKIASKWEEFGVMIIDYEEVKKIRADITGKESVVTYCFNEVITTWLKGKKQYLTKEILIQALKVVHERVLADKVRDDPNFEFTHMYLLQLLRPIRSKYCEFGIQLGVSVPKIKEDEVIRGDCNYCLIMVITKWFGNRPKMEKLWGALEYIGQERLKEDLQVKYKGLLFPGDDDNEAEKIDTT